MDDRMAQRPGVSPGDLFWLFLFLNFLLIVFIRDIVVDQIVYWEWTDADGAASMGRLLAPLAAFAALVSLYLARRVLPWLAGLVSPGLGWKVSAATEATERGVRLLLCGTGRALSALGRGVKGAAALAGRTVRWAGRRSRQGAIHLWDFTGPLRRSTGRAARLLAKGLQVVAQAVGGLALLLWDGLWTVAGLVAAALRRVLKKTGAALLAMVKWGWDAVHHGADLLWESSRPLRRVTGRALLGLRSALGAVLRAIGGLAVVLLNGLRQAAGLGGTALLRLLKMTAGALLWASTWSGRAVGHGVRSLWSSSQPIRHTAVVALLGLGAVLLDVLKVTGRALASILKVLRAAASKMATALRTHLGRVLAHLKAVIGRTIGAALRGVGRLGALLGQVATAAATATGAFLGGVLGAVTRGASRTAEALGKAASASRRSAGTALGGAGTATGHVFSSAAGHARKALERLREPVLSALETAIVVTGLAVAGGLAVLAALVALAIGSVRMGWAGTRKLAAWAWDRISAAARLAGRALGKTGRSCAGVLGKGAAAVGWTTLSAGIAMVGTVVAASRPLADALAALRRALATGLDAVWSAVSQGVRRSFSSLGGALGRAGRLLGKTAKNTYAHGKPLVVARAHGLRVAAKSAWESATWPIVIGYRLIKGTVSSALRVAGRAARAARRPLGRAATAAWDAAEHGGRATGAMLSTLWEGFAGGVKLVGAGLRLLGTLVAPPVGQLLTSASRQVARVRPRLSRGAHAGAALTWAPLESINHPGLPVPGAPRPSGQSARAGRGRRAGGGGSGRPRGLGGGGRGEEEGRALGGAVHGRCVRPARPGDGGRREHGARRLRPAAHGDRRRTALRTHPHPRVRGLRGCVRSSGRVLD